jgi:peptide/nickel transport system substrate-binding protein
MIASRQRVLAVFCMAAALVAGGCSSDDDAGSTSTKNGKIELIEAQSPAEKPVDLVKWGLSFGEPLSLDPAHAFGESEETVLANLCEKPLRLQPDFSLAPGLATKADWKNAKTFVIDLREGVKFWDGSPLTADDVVYSLSRNLDPKVQSAWGQGYSRVAGIEKTGPLQVTLKFKEHDAQFRNTLASNGAAILQAKHVEEGGKDFGTPTGGLMCTGPYKLVKWTPGDQIKIAKNDGYWDGVPKVGSIEFKFITDGSTMTSALLAGQIDGTFNAPLGGIDALSKSDTGRLLIGPSDLFYGFFPTTPSGPAADPKVREALDLAIDKDAYVKSVLHGYGEPLKTMTPPIAWQSIPGSDIYRAAYDRLPSNAQDLDKAKALIAEAKPGEKTLVFALKGGDTLALQSATLVQAAAKELGFNAKLKTLQPTDFDAFFFDPSKREGVDFVVSPGWLGQPGAYAYAPGYVLKDGFFNYTGYDNPKVTELMTTGQAASDPDESARLFGQAQELFTRDRLFIPLGSQYERVFLNNRLTGITTSTAFFENPWALHLGGA